MDQASESFLAGAPPPSPASPPPEPSPLLTWPKTVQLVLVLIVVAGLFFLLGRWSLERSSPQFLVEAALERNGPCLDLNRATKSELRALPGVGEVMAQRIIDHRARHGPFRQFDDLGQVHGVGPKMLARLRPLLFVALHNGAIEEEEERARPLVKKAAKARAAATTKKHAQLTAPIDVNQADQAELQKLPGIGPKLSQRILDERAKGPFKSVADLRRVSGIGPKTLEKLRPYVRIEPPRALAVE